MSTETNACYLFKQCINDAQSMQFTIYYNLVLQKAARTAGNYIPMFCLRKVPFQMSKVWVLAKAKLMKLFETDPALELLRTLALHSIIRLRFRMKEVLQPLFLPSLCFIGDETAKNTVLLYIHQILLKKDHSEWSRQLFLRR